MYKFNELRTGPVNIIIAFFVCIAAFFGMKIIYPLVGDDVFTPIFFGFLLFTAFAIIFEWYVKLAEIIWFTPARIRDNITTRSLEKLNKIRVAENKAKREFERFIEDCRK
ncbi:hypothetical protein KNT87_gp122 [Erwinia phage Cronus]|uniref:Uncharacterized protein n=1 Tax=Erwinia phage Cronus TaxID=2163633 RepID=A0A2S1GME4_9CAUD|nr:hypothetical protein KNT87_gp122 [Erwinia phage Cronus]AWD90561.1 hypothetical protein [Erwinia phage Cronus]